MSFGAEYWLYLLLAIPLLMLIYYQTDKKAWAKLDAFSNNKILEKLTVSFSSKRRNTKYGLSLFALMLIIISVARPEYGYHWVETSGRGIDIMIAFDVSKSMLAEDIKPNRLERAKLAIFDFMKKIEGDRIGLIAFSGTAFLHSPLTLDYDSFRLSLQDMDTNTIPLPGTDIATAISEAQASLNSKNNFKLLVLITDGEDLEESGIEQAVEAAEDGIVIYTVGVGSAEGDLIPYKDTQGNLDYIRDEAGNPVKTKLDSESLTSMASVTNGFYVPLGPLGEGLDEIYKQALQSIPQEEKESRLQKVPVDYYQWPLLLGIIILFFEPLINTRKNETSKILSKGKYAALLLFSFVLLLLPKFSEASIWQADKNYNNGNFKEAEKLYREALLKEPDNKRLHFNLGTSLYKQQKFEKAIDSLLNALNTSDVNLQSDTLFNLGNVYFQFGFKLKESDPDKALEYLELGIKSYRDALQIDPEDKDIKNNFELLEDVVEKFSFELILEAYPEDAVRLLTGAGRHVKGSSVDVRADPEKNYKFSKWEGDDVLDVEKSETSVLLDKSKTVKAYFNQLFDLNLIAEPKEGGTAEKGGVYENGAQIPISAKRNKGFRFIEWKGEGIDDSKQPQSTVVIDKDKTVTAIFKAGIELTLKTFPENRGQLTGENAYDKNFDAEISVTPIPGFEFINWIGSGIEDNQSDKTKVTVDQPKVITAKLNRIWNLIVVPSDQAGGQVTGGGNYPDGTNVEITATPNEGFEFVKWEGENIQNSNSEKTTVTVYGNQDVFAIFSKPDHENQNQEDQKHNEQKQDNQNQEEQKQGNDNQDKQDQGQNKENQNQDDKKQGGDDKKKQDEMKSDSKQDEPDEKDKNKEKKDDSAEKKSDSDSSEKNKEHNQTPTKDSIDEKEKNRKRIQGRMTREEALQLLEKLRNSEKKLLPAGKLNQLENESKSNKKRRDW